MVHPGGRPRTVCPEHDELVELGKDLLQWATEETNELRCRFCQWYSLKHMILGRVWDLMIEKAEFHGYYESARAALAQRYMNGAVNPSIAHRFVRIYMPEVKRDEEEKARFEAELKAKVEESPVDAMIAEQQSALMNQISVLQESIKTSRSIKSKDK